MEDGARTGPVLFPLLPFLSGRHGKEPKLHPGMRIRYLVPSPIRLSTRNVPPWDSTMCLAMESGSPEFAGPRLVDPVEPLDRKSFFARRGREGDSPLPAVFFLAETALPTPLAESAPILRVPRPTRPLPAPYRRQYTCLDTGGNPESRAHGQRYPGAPSCHRTTTGPKIRQTAARVSDRYRYRRQADGITVIGVREGRQQALGAAPRCPWSRYAGAHREKGEGLCR